MAVLATLACESGCSRVEFRECDFCVEFRESRRGFLIALRGRARVPAPGLFEVDVDTQAILVVEAESVLRFGISSVCCQLAIAKGLPVTRRTFLVEDDRCGIMRWYEARSAAL